MLLIISKSLSAALTAIALWGASSIWDQSSTIHNLRAGCRELNPDGPRNYLHEAEIGVGLALITPRRWKGPAVTIWFGSSAFVHANAATHNQNLFHDCHH